jgi:HK97 family phage portal protein
MFKNLFKKNIDVIRYASPVTDGYDDFSEVVVTENYKDSLAVSIALSKVASVFASVDFNLFRVLNSQGEAQKIEVHEVLDLLYKPNKFQTKTEFMMLYAYQMKLSGEAFIRIFRENNKITELMLVEPKSVEVKIKNGEIIYRISKKDGTYIELTTFEIVHIKTPDPENNLRGLGIMRALKYPMIADIKASRYQAKNLENSGQLDGIVTVETNDVGVLETIRKRWRATFAGNKQGDRTAFLGGTAKYNQLSVSPRELDYLESKKQNAEDIITAIGVPISMVNPKGINRATADTEYRMFIESTIAPMVHLFSESINERFIAPNYSEAYFIKSHDILTEDKDLRLQEITQWTDKVVTINESRKRLGLDPVDGGDELGTMQIQTAPMIMQNAFKGRSYLYKKFIEIEKIKEQKRKEAVVEIVMSPEYRAKFQKAYGKVQDSAERYIKNKIKEFFNEQKDRTLKKLKDNPDFNHPGEIFDLSIEAEMLYELAKDIFGKVAKTSGNLSLVPVKMFHQSHKDFYLDNQDMKSIEDRAEFFANNVTGVTYDKVQKAIKAGGESGSAGIAKSLRKLFTDMSKSRANTIARTESAYAVSLGSQMAYEQSPVVEGKQWLSTMDDKVRPEHAENNMKIVDKNQSFPNGEAFPGQKSVNCRCAIAPVVRL